MMAPFLWLFSRLGWAGCAALLALAYYEGVPCLNRLPLIDHVPVLREFVVGRVELERREAVAGLVAQSALDAEKAKAEEMQRLLDAAQAASDAERERAAALARVADDRQAAIERLRTDAQKVPGLTYPSKEDLQWLAQ